MHIYVDMYVSVIVYIFWSLQVAVGYKCVWSLRYTYCILMLPLAIPKFIFSLFIYFLCSFAICTFMLIEYIFWKKRGFRNFPAE